MVSFSMISVLVTVLMMSEVTISAVFREAKTFLFPGFFTKPNGPCMGKSNKTGICSTAKDCASRQGIEDGFCHRPYGVCCILMVTCDKMTNAKVSYFVNPEYPGMSNESRRCRMLLELFDDSICQVRLDFESFQLGPPTLGECEEDFFQYIGPEDQFPRVCGNNNGQHVFIEVEKFLGPITMMVITSGYKEMRRWSIKIRQIPCKKTHMLAPPGCLQYFPDTTGILQSFNFHEDPKRRSYPNDFAYAMCLQRTPGFCGVKFEGFNTSFDIGFASTTEECVDDFLQFQFGMPRHPRRYLNRICRASFNTTSVSSFKVRIVGPPIVFFFSDSTGSRPAGFKLSYSLTPC